MQIIITGGAGFLGQRLCKALLKSEQKFDEILLVDINLPENPEKNPRVRCQQIDLSQIGKPGALITEKTSLIFHLAAIVSSHAEKDFDLGWRVNLDVTRLLLEACRLARPGIRFIFSSSLAVFGGKLPAIVNDNTAVNPASSYGAQKAMGELLVNDYSRKKFVEGVVLRLPTVCVRPGRPNQAASSFVSSIIREPLNGELAICPVSPDLVIWLSSPRTIIQNLLHAATMAVSAVGDWRTINLPGISVTVKEMLNSLKRITNAEMIEKVQFKHEASIDRIVGSWPGVLDNSRALQLGFQVDSHFDEFIKQYLVDYNIQTV
ncbi:MAG: D-erythronate dehydrogenase [Cyclobacteriaceae bacterium]